MAWPRPRASRQRPRASLVGQSGLIPRAPGVMARRLAAMAGAPGLIPGPTRPMAKAVRPMARRAAPSLQAPEPMPRQPGVIEWKSAPLPRAPAPLPSAPRRMDRASRPSPSPALSFREKDSPFAEKLPARIRSRGVAESRSRGVALRSDAQGCCGGRTHGLGRNINGREMARRNVGPTIRRSGRMGAGGGMERRFCCGRVSGVVGGKVVVLHMAQRADESSAPHSRRIRVSQAGGVWLER